MSFREAKSTFVNWLNTDVASGFSNFRFIDNNYKSHRALRRILSIARKLNYKSLLIEEIDESESSTLAEENDAIKKVRPDFKKSKVHRLCFFSSSIDNKPLSKNFLGYAIFKEDIFSSSSKPYVFESVLQSPRKANENNFIHSSHNYEIKTSKGNFTVQGTLYAQQNGITHRCSHASLRTALSSILPEGDISYSKLNSLVGIDHQTLLVGDGLDRGQIELILSSLGVSFKSVIHEPDKNLTLNVDYQKYLYGIIESGYPALVGFELDQKNPSDKKFPRHMICVIGHTFNEDAWVAEAQRMYFQSTGYYSSENWMSTFVLHDDNVGPYFCLPRHFLKQKNFRIICGIQPFSSELQAIETEALALMYINTFRNVLPQPSKSYWYNRFNVFGDNASLILRSLLIDRNAYLEHLRMLKDIENKLIEKSVVDRIENLLPEHFWLIEISAPELFATSRRKFGEIIINPSGKISSSSNASLFLAARFPSLFLLKLDNGKIDVVPTDLQGHTRLFSMDAP